MDGATFLDDQSAMSIQSISHTDVTHGGYLGFFARYHDFRNWTVSASVDNHRPLSFRGQGQHAIAKHPRGCATVERSDIGEFRGETSEADVGNGASPIGPAAEIERPLFAIEPDPLHDGIASVNVA